MNGPYSITVAWDASSTSSSNWWYCIQRDGQGCIRVDPPQTTFTFSRLWPGTTFNYSVVAITSTGKRSASSNSVYLPADTTAPSAPTLSLTGNWPVRISVAWTASVDDVGSQVWYTLLVNGTSYGADQIGYRSALVLDRAPETTYAPGDRPRLLRQHEPEQRRHRDDSGSHRQNTTDDADEPAPVAAGLCARDLARVESGRRTTPIRSPRSCTTST